MSAAKAKTLDFTGVKDASGNFRPRRKAEGDYFATIVAVADHTSKEARKSDTDAAPDNWVFTIKVDGDSRSTYPYYVGFDPNQLWKARGLCLAAGMKVPPAKVKLDPNKLVGKSIGIALEDDEYEGKVKSAIVAVMPLDDLDDPQNVRGNAKAKGRAVEEDDDDEDEDEEPVTPKKSSKKRQPEPDDDDDDDDEDDEEPPAKSKKKTVVKSSKKRPVEDDEDDEDDDEDDEPTPPKRKAAPVKKGKAKRKNDDDDDDELDIDDL